MDIGQTELVWYNNYGVKLRLLSKTVRRCTGGHFSVIFAAKSFQSVNCTSTVTINETREAIKKIYVKKHIKS